jgi:predicted XRE-type DNA-binding protein/phage-related protein
MADALTTALQNGSTLPAGRYRQREGSLIGASEFRIPHDGDTYRCYQVVAYEEVIYILDAGMKKSSRGGEMPKHDKERLERRLSLAKEAYKSDARGIKDEYAARAASHRTGSVPDRGEIEVVDEENSGPIRGSGNFLLDRGYAEPDEMRIKFLLANEIALAIEGRGLTEQRAAELTGLDEPALSRIARGQVTDCSLFLLMRPLASLGKDVRLEWSDASDGEGHIMADAHATPEAA